MTDRIEGSSSGIISALPPVTKHELCIVLVYICNNLNFEIVNNSSTAMLWKKYFSNAFITILNWS
jgi:hypothetical protein